MDDCDLEKLSIKPGKLTPAFNKNTVDYNVITPSDVAQVTFDCFTSDSGASYIILGSGGSKTIQLPEGVVTDVKIEVTAEDGKTMKIYVVHVKRISPKDATLTGLSPSAGILEPDFSSDCFQYTCNLPCTVCSLTVTTKVPDAKCAVTVCGQNSSEPVSLNTGQTFISVEVKSADGSTNGLYNIRVLKTQIPRYVKIKDPVMRAKYECPISLSVLYLPVTVSSNTESRNTYSGPIIDEFTKTNKVDPLSEEPLISDWRLEDNEIEKKVNECIGVIPLTNGGFTEDAKYKDIGGLVEKCNIQPKSVNLQDKFKAQEKPNHSLQVRSWEKQLQQIFDESDPDKLAKLGQECTEKYFKSLPKPGIKARFAEGQSPVDYLHDACCHFASAIKNKSRDASLHLKLGILLEEKYYAEDRFGLKKEEYQLPALNEAKESSKKEEVIAICKLRGVSENAPLALRLKAVDEEYHHLIDTGQSGKADHVQELYVWKSKQASQEGAAAQKASDEECPLGQAYQKYMDAMVIDDSKAVYNFHVGRMLVIQGEYDDAVKRLETALSWNPGHEASSFYLGLALAMKKNGPGERIDETINYLLVAMETLLTKNTETSDVPVKLHADDVISMSNIHLLRAIIQLGLLLRKKTDMKEVMSAEDVFHTAALLATQALPVTCRGDTYKQLEWILLDAHANLLELLLENQKGNEDLIVKSCQQLSALIKRSTIPENVQLISLQQKTCEKLVLINPCDSHSLYLLGCAQFVDCENSMGDKSDKILEDARKSFIASIDLEDKPASGEPPVNVKEQTWWQERVKQEEEKKKAEEVKAPAKGAPTPRGGAGATRGRGTTQRGGPGNRVAPVRGIQAKGAPARGVPVRGTPSRGATTAKAPAKPARGAATPVRGTSKPASATAKSTAKPASATKVAENSTPTEEKEAKPTSQANKKVPINRKTHQARLGLARALARKPEHREEAKKYYNEVMAMAPEVHDAYIELAEMLIDKDPLGAVDVYSKFPVSETASFDDAYIHGEIVRLLVKHEQYDDPRLGPNMIAWGKIMGLAILDKYVKILDDKFKSKLLMEVYAGVNGRSVDNPDMQSFFKHKCWI